MRDVALRSSPSKMTMPSSTRACFSSASSCLRIGCGMYRFSMFGLLKSMVPFHRPRTWAVAISGVTSSFCSDRVLTTMSPRMYPSRPVIPAYRLPRSARVARFSAYPRTVASAQSRPT